MKASLVKYPVVGVVLVALASLGACTSGSSSSSSSCTTDADCPTGLGCGFSIRDGCNAKGRCVKIEHGMVECQLGQWRCACDGGSTEVINFDEIDHLTTRPSTDGVCRAMNPEGTECTGDVACADNLICAHLVSDGCQGPNTPNPLGCGKCIRPSVCPFPKTSRAACDCRGTALTIDCVYPDGWAPSAVSAMGACSLDAGADAVAPSDASRDGD